MGINVATLDAEQRQQLANVDLMHTPALMAAAFKARPDDALPYPMTIPGKRQRSRLRRLQCSRFWKRTLKDGKRKAQEYQRLSRREIGKDSGTHYASDTSTAQMKIDRERSEEWAMQNKLVNRSDAGAVLDLLAVMQKKKAHRFAELFAFCKGMEHMANEDGRTAVMLTLTCPPRFHAAPGNGGDAWDGSTPKDGADYLNDLWQGICQRLQWHYGDNRPYGLRTREPQKDATPHDHILVYLDVGQRETLVQAVRELSGSDPDNDKDHGADIVDIDPEIGSASSYMYKYLAKNIDRADLIGRNEHSEVERVEAWRQRWNIRAFQFFGMVAGARSVWKDLRRLRPEDVATVDDAAERETLQKLQGAALDNDCGAFLMLLRARKVCGIYYEERTGQYGDDYKTPRGLRTLEGETLERDTFELLGINEAIEEKSVTNAPAEPSRFQSPCRSPESCDYWSKGGTASPVTTLPRSLEAPPNQDILLRGLLRKQPHKHFV